MNAFDDLHRESSCCSVVHQADEDLWCGALTDRLERRGAFAAGHIGQTALGFTTLQAFQMQTEICSLAKCQMIFGILCFAHIAALRSAEFCILARFSLNSCACFAATLLVSKKQTQFHGIKCKDMLLLPQTVTSICKYQRHGVFR